MTTQERIDAIVALTRVIEVTGYGDACKAAKKKLTELITLL